MTTGEAHTNRRFGICAVGLSSALVVGCTQMLGIDGEYVLSDRPVKSASGAGGSFDRDARSVSPFDGTGGALVTGAGGGGVGGVAVGSGGVPGTLPTPGAGGIVPCTSCPPPATTSCPSGTYAGNISGQHAASVLAGFRLPVTGTVTISVAPDASGTSATVSGTIQGSATIAPSSFADFTATLGGSFDCAGGVLNGTISGSYTIAPGTPPVPFAGTNDGSFANAAFSGTWSEHETASSSSNQFFGTGKWDAARTGP